MDVQLEKKIISAIQTISRKCYTQQYRAPLFFQGKHFLQI